MKVIAKQKQFSIAIKRRKVCNIEWLVNDPEVDPAINDNWAISTALHNWEIFDLLNSSGRVDPFQNYTRNIVGSISAKDKRIFNYLRNNEQFKNNIRECLFTAYAYDFELFKELYFHKNYSNEEKEKDFNKLLILAFRDNKMDVFHFLFDIYKDREIDFSEFSVDYYMFPHKLEFLSENPERLSHIDLNNFLKEMIRHKKEDCFKVLMNSKIDFDVKETFILLLEEYFPLSKRSCKEDFEKIKKMIGYLIKNDKSLKICQSLKTDNDEIYLEFKKEMDTKLLSTNLKEF